MGLRDEDGNYYIRAKRTGNNKRKNALPVMYEEDIYMGYRYYETAAAEAAASNYNGFDYADEVAYPFGHGLSYTTFKKEIVNSDVKAWTDMSASGWTLNNDWYNDGKMTIDVKVTKPRLRWNRIGRRRPVFCEKNFVRKPDRGRVFV